MESFNPNFTDSDIRHKTGIRCKLPSVIVKEPVRIVVSCNNEILTKFEVNAREWLNFCFVAAINPDCSCGSIGLEFAIKVAHVTILEEATPIGFALSVENCLDGTVSVDRFNEICDIYNMRNIEAKRLSIRLMQTCTSHRDLVVNNIGSGKISWSWE